MKSIRILNGGGKGISRTISTHVNRDRDVSLIAEYFGIYQISKWGNTSVLEYYESDPTKRKV